MNALAPMPRKWVVIGRSVAIALAILVCINSWRYHHDLCESINRGSRLWLRIHLLLPEDVNAGGQQGLTPIGCAILRDDRRALDLLLRHRADPDHPMPGGAYAGRVPLQIAAEMANGPMIARLLEAGGDPDARDSRTGETALHTTRVPALATQILDGAADPNARDAQGRTPLMAMARVGERKVIRVLLARGADPTLVDDDGLTAAEVARTVGRPDLYRTLCGASARWERGREDGSRPPAGPELLDESAAVESTAGESMAHES